MGVAKNVVVERIESRSVNKRDGSSATVFDVVVGGGTKFQWSWYERPNVMEGQTVSFKFHTDKYGHKVDKNSVIPGGDGGPPAIDLGGAEEPAYSGRGGGSASAGASSSDDDVPLGRQRSIIRQSSLERALTLVLAADTKSASNDQIADEAIRVAKKFERYAAGDEDVANTPVAASTPAVPTASPTPVPANTQQAGLMSEVPPENPTSPPWQAHA